MSSIVDIASFVFLKGKKMEASLVGYKYCGYVEQRTDEYKEVALTAGYQYLIKLAQLLF